MIQSIHVKSRDRFDTSAVLNRIIPNPSSTFAGLTVLSSPQILARESDYDDKFKSNDMKFLICNHSDFDDMLPYVSSVENTRYINHYMIYHTSLSSDLSQCESTLCSSNLRFYQMPTATTSSKLLFSSILLSKYLDKVKVFLGIDAVRRIESFLIIPKGWDDGAGEVFSYPSLKTFVDFLSVWNSFPEGEPSIFMTRNGNIQVEWEDRDGNGFEIEFFADCYEYFFEPSDEENELSINETDTLVAKLSSFQI